MRIDSVGSVDVQAHRALGEGTAPQEAVAGAEGAVKEENPRQEAPAELSPEALNSYIDELNQAAAWVNKSLRFNLHAASDRMQVLVINTQNQEVIKEIPPEKVLDLIGKIREMVGVLLDQRV